MAYIQERRSLLSSQARVQAPWIKVTIGKYTFGVFSKVEADITDENGFYKAFNIQYPNYIQGLNIVKINGQVNQYTLSLSYPITPEDDPNFFEKVFSSVSSTRKIVFSYGDSSMPSYIYKDEEAIITKITQSFSLESSVITYQISAVSGAALANSGCYSFMNSEKKRPSDEIKRIFNDSSYGLQSIFTGMNSKNISKLICSDDKEVELSSKLNISAMDYLLYLVSCMIPAGTEESNISKDIYILTIHDDTTYDRLYSDRELVDGKEIVGSYFKVEKTSYAKDHSDAYEIDIGYNTSTVVTNFSIQDNENYSMYYDYQNNLNQETYVRRINDHGKWEDVYAPAITSKNEKFQTRPEDITWWTKITKYPVNASITIMGLLRPATLMQYVRLNVIFPGGHKHVSSGLYIVTSQTDQIDGNGYRTTLALTKIEGDTNLT